MFTNTGVSLNLCNVNNIHVIYWFIKKKNISPLKHITGKGQLHMPSSRKGGYTVIRIGFSVRYETYSGKYFSYLFLGTSDSLNLLVNEYST